MQREIVGGRLWQRRGRSHTCVNKAILVGCFVAANVVNDGDGDDNDTANFLQ